jgi:hypothetical protein
MVIHLADASADVRGPPRFQWLPRTKHSWKFEEIYSKVQRWWSVDYHECVDFLNKFVCNQRRPSSSFIVMDIYSAIFTGPNPFLHNNSLLFAQISLCIVAAEYCLAAKNLITERTSHLAGFSIAAHFLVWNETSVPR